MLSREAMKRLTNRSSPPVVYTSSPYLAWFSSPSPTQHQKPVLGRRDHAVVARSHWCEVHQPAHGMQGRQDVVDLRSLVVVEHLGVRLVEEQRAANLSRL
jgi:hypothetical protein